MNSYYVYILQEDKASATAPIKIGVSHDVARRFVCIQTGNPRALELRATFGPMSRMEAFGFERHLQDKLHRYRLRGEWYSGKALKMIFEQPATESAFLC